MLSSSSSGSLNAMTSNEIVDISAVTDQIKTKAACGKCHGPCSLRSVALGGVVRSTEVFCSAWDEVKRNSVIVTPPKLFLRSHLDIH